jgi:hypothetical protein
VKIEYNYGIIDKVIKNLQLLKLACVIFALVKKIEIE